jgi:hypothetical protein
MYAPFKPFVCAAGAHPNPFDEYYAPPFVTMCAVDVTRLLTRLPPSVSSGVCAIFHFGRTDNSIAPTKKWDLKWNHKCFTTAKCFSTAHDLCILVKYFEI